MKFSSGNELDFVKLSQTPVRMERENNFKEYKTANDLDQLPKFGAGSEFGREQKEIARKKKYGIMMKNYNPNDQPWLLKIGKNKEMKKYKGVREGTITENTSYYIFTQCADGAFEAFPVEEWYNFSPMIRYKYLNSDEAEEEFTRRDKTLNYFSIMVRKRCRNDEDPDQSVDDGENVKVKSSKKKGKDLLLTDMDEWFDMSDDEDDDDDDENEDKDKGDSQKGKKLAKKVKQKRNAKHNSDDEAIEESDEGDYDDREVDYISDSGSSSEEEVSKKDKYEEKGVDEEKGLRKLIDSEEEESEEEEKKEEENNDKEEKSKKGSESESSSSSSGEDSDIEKDENLSSAIFLQKSEAKRNSPVPRSDTPSSIDNDDKKSLKRKHEAESSTSKKIRTDSPSVGSAKDGITESAIRRYLTRKPMTTKELVQKFNAKKLNLTKEQMTSTIAQLVKKINPDKKFINNKLYLSLKAD